MTKKRLIFLGLILAVSILGQVMLRPCLGGSDNSGIGSESDKRVIESWQLQSDKQTDSLQGKLTTQFFMMIGCVAVIGLGMWWFIQRMYCPVKAAGPGKNLVVLETMHLGARKTIHLIQAGKKRLVISNTNEGIRLLTDLSETSDASIQQTD